MTQERIKPENKKEDRGRAKKKKSGCVIVGLILLMVIVLGFSFTLMNLFSFLAFNLTSRVTVAPPTITPPRSSAPIRVTPTMPTPTPMQVILICDECERAGLGINVWVRKGTGAGVAFTVPNRTVVNLFAKDFLLDEVWYQVEYQGQTGWTLEDYVNPYSD